MDIETMPHTMYFTGNSDTVTKINQVPYQTIQYNENGMFTAKLINENVQITHDRLITLENRTAMMAKAIIPVLKDFKQQINNTNDRLYRQYRMMMRAHDRYNRLFRQTHKTFQIHHLALLMLKDYITILLGMLQRIHRQYIRYESALDDTLIGIEHLNSGYLTHRILEPSSIPRSS